MSPAHQTAETVNRFPLEWPAGWTRTGANRRKNGRFKKDGVWISVIAATARLERELDKLGARSTTLSTNGSLRLDGRPRSGEKPADPGAAIYFSYKGRATVLACDTYFLLADNIAALAAHLEALRAIERYGVGTIEQALAGYKALPADTAADWRVVFGFTPGPVEVHQVDQVFRELARERHPDITHDDGAAMAHLNRARDYALQELEGR